MISDNILWQCFGSTVGENLNENNCCVNKVFMTLAFSIRLDIFFILNIDIYNAFRQRSKVNKQTNKQKSTKKK